MVRQLHCVRLRWKYTERVPTPSSILQQSTTMTLLWSLGLMLRILVATSFGTVPVCRGLLVMSDIPGWFVINFCIVSFEYVGR